MSKATIPEKAVTHTKGPWAFETQPVEADTDPDFKLDEDVAFWIVDTKVAGEVLATVLKTARHEDLGNARLLAAAPDLLLAAKFALSVLRKNGLFELSERLAEEKLVAAIAKAEGGGQ